MKYKITDETIKYLGKTLYRIEALCTFDDVKIGDKGGFIESENNLSQEGTCWVYGNAKVFDNAKVCDNVKVYGDAKIKDNSYIADYAKIYGSACIEDRAYIKNNAQIYDFANISGDAIISNNTKVYESAMIRGRVIIRGNSKIYGKSKVTGNAHIFNAEVKDTSDYIVFKNWWSSGRYFTWTRSNNMWNVGCFYGTGEELIAKAYKDSEYSGREYERIVKYVESILI